MSLLQPFATLDFKQAKANHLLFKSRLRAILYGEVPEQEATVLSQYACALGKWIYSHALIQFESIPEVHELEKVHASIHIIARDLISRYKEGNITEARLGLSDMEQIADRLVQLLQIVEEKVITSPETVPHESYSDDPAILLTLLAKNEKLDAKIKDQIATEKNAYLKLNDERNILHDFFMQAPAAHCILRGPTHIFELANPAYRKLVGDRDLLGTTVRQALPELEGQGFFELLDRVFTTCKPFVGNELPILLDRSKGQAKTIYLNFIYQPILNGAGKAEGILVFAYEVTEQVMARKAIEVSEERFRNLIEKAPVAITLLVGRDLVIQYPNETVLKIWGGEDTITGKPLREALHDYVEQPFLKTLDKVYTTGVAHYAQAATAKLGIGGQLKTYYFNVSYQPLHDEVGDVYAILVIGIDVTEQVLATKQTKESEARYRELSAELDARVRQRTQALEEANTDLRRSNENLEQFAYIASHDLQEPLRKIQQFGDLLKMQYTGSEGDELVYLQRMQDAASRMSMLIKDLLAFSRISTRQISTAMVSLNQVVDRALENLSVAIDEANAQIRVSTLPNIQGDASQLGHLFQNLLSNAIKFRLPGVIPEILISASEVLASNLPSSLSFGRQAEIYHQIKVSDNGIGFENKYIDRIFQVFQRLHAKNKFAGTGIGLAICQKVAANHGGAITATSQSGKGSTFYIYLPI